MFAIDLSNPNRPFGYQYVYTVPAGSTTAPVNATAEFDSPEPTRKTTKRTGEDD